MATIIDVADILGVCDRSCRERAVLRATSTDTWYSVDLACRLLADVADPNFVLPEKMELLIPLNLLALRGELLLKR